MCNECNAKACPTCTAQRARQQYSVGNVVADLMSDQWEVWGRETQPEYKAAFSQAFDALNIAESLWYNPESREKALRSYQHAFELATFIGNYAMQGSICMGLGYAFIDAGRAREAYEKFSVAKQIARNHGNNKQADIANMFMQMAAGKMEAQDTAVMQSVQHSGVHKKRARHCKKGKASQLDMCVTREQQEVAERNMAELLELLEDEEKAHAKRTQKQKRKGKRQVLASEKLDEQGKLDNSEETQKRAPALDFGQDTQPEQHEPQKIGDQHSLLEAVPISAEEPDHEEEHFEAEQLHMALLEDWQQDIPNGRFGAQVAHVELESADEPEQEPRVMVEDRPEALMSLSRGLLLQHRNMGTVAESRRQCNENDSVFPPIQKCNDVGRIEYKNCSDDSTRDCPTSAASVASDSQDPLLRELGSGGGYSGFAVHSIEPLDAAGLQDFLCKMQASIAFPPGLEPPPGLGEPQLQLEVKVGTTFLGSCMVTVPN